MLFKLLADEPKEDVTAAVAALKADYENRPGLQLVEVAGGYQIVTRPELHEWVRRLFHERSTQKLTVQGARDAGRDRLQAADHGARDRRDPRRQHVGRALDAARASPDQDRRPQERRRPSVPVRDDEGVPDPVRPERSERPAEDRGHGRSARLRSAGGTHRADAARGDAAARGGDGRSRTLGWARRSRDEARVSAFVVPALPATAPLRASPHFVGRQLPPLARLQPAIGDRTDPRPLQRLHRVADGFAHPAHLPVAPFPDRQHAATPSRVAAAVPLQQHRPSAGSVRRPSSGMPFRSRSSASLVRHAGDARLVRALDAVPRVRQPRGEVAVVGQQQQALGVVVEPPDRIDVLAHAAEQIDHRAAPLRDPIAWSRSPPAC